MKRSEKINWAIRGAKGAKWTQEMVDEFMEEFKRGMNTSHEPLPEYAGYRRTEINGEVREEVFRDGEWVPLGEVTEQHTLDFDLTQSDNSFEMTFDVSQYIPYGNMSVEASVNNGVLSLSFTPADE